MATKAELQAELDSLRAKMAELDDLDRTADASQKEEPEQEQSQPEPTHGSKSGLSDAASELERILAPHGVSSSDIEALAKQLWEELDNLPQNKPLVTAIGAFALGFLIGRMTK